MSVEEKLLSIHRLGLYATFNPEQISSTYLLLVNYLRNNINKIESIKYYDLLELQFYLSLLSNKDSEAKTCLDRIIDKFGDQDSQRTAVLKATFLESTIDNKNAIDYLNKRNSNELTCLKKRVALSKKITSTPDYIKALNGYLNLSPLDTEVWLELSDIYYEIGHFEKSIFALQDILLIIPFAYNIFAKIGNIEFAIFKRDGDVDSLVSSLKHFLRSVELSSNFIRGWSGIYLISKEFNQLDSKKLKNVKIDYVELNKLSKNRLKEIIETNGSNAQDLKAAEQLLRDF